MATRKPKTEVNKALASETPERFKMGEMGYLGNNIWQGVTKDELKKELNFPYSIETFKNMSYHGTVNSALTLFHNLISKVNWKVTPPVDATDAEKKQAAMIATMMHDMETSWTDFVSDVLSAQTFGFSVHEKVYRRRLKANGSKFDDGTIGWKKLPIRSQETIDKFIFSDDGNEILGVKQDLDRVNDVYNRYQKRENRTVVLPRSKFMLFRVGKHKGDPYGKSPLRDAYMAWRYLTIIEEIESNGVAKDLVGLPVLKLPPQYLSSDASPEQKSIKAYYENVMRNLQLNQQSALILPNAFDPESGKPLFELDLLSLDGKKGMDTSKIKEYYKNLILTSLFADVLVMGQTATGSFALGQIKNSLSGAAAEAVLKTIVDTLNADLMRQTYDLNGWDTSRMATFDYDELEGDDLETFSKAVQRYSSTGMLEKDREVYNAVRSSIGVDALPDDMPVQEDKLTMQDSKSGQGFATAGEGTAKAPSGRDTSSNNSENAG